MTAANISNSLSSKAVLGLILTKSINLLKDTEKIGLYVQLIEETLETLVSVYRVEGNPEFSEILHLYLFSFDGVSTSLCDNLIGIRLLQRCSIQRDSNQFSAYSCCKVHHSSE